MSTPEAQAVPPEIQQELRHRWKVLRLAGILALIGGAVAILVPAIASVATAIFIGWILLFAGAWMLFDAWSVRGSGRIFVRVAEAVALRHMPGAGIGGVNGALSLLIGLLILLDFPSSADWAIGLLVGIDLLFAGWGLLTVSGLGKRLAAA